MYNTIASLIHFSLVNNIEKVTYNDNNQSDGTLIHEINVYLKNYPNQYNLVIDILKNKLNSEEPNVIFKSLKLVKQLFLKAPNNYQGLFNSLHDPIRKCCDFRHKKNQSLITFATAEDIREESHSLLRLLIGESKDIKKINHVAPINRIESLTSSKHSFQILNSTNNDNQDEEFNISLCLGEWMDDLIDFGNGGDYEKNMIQTNEQITPIQRLIIDYANRSNLSLIDIDEFMNQLTNESNLDMAFYENFIQIPYLDERDWKFQLNLLILIESCIKNDLKGCRDYFKKNEHLIKDMGNKTTRISIKRIINDIIEIL